MTTISAPPSPGDLLDPDVHATGGTHAVWRWMRHHAPVHRHEAGEYPAFWSVTRYADVKAVYRDPMTFSSAHGVLLRPAGQGRDPGGTLTLALTDPPRHKQIRSLMAGWFTERAVRSMEDSIGTAVRLVLHRAAGMDHCDAVHDIVARLSLYVIGSIAGVPDEDLEQLHLWTDEAFAAGRPLATHHRVMGYFADLMDERAETATGDLVSALVHGEVAGRPLTEEEVILNLENLIGATENARLSMAAGIVAFLEHPRQWERLRADRSLLPSAVEEILRFASSATHSMRRATADTEIGGRRIAAGDRVVVWVPSANRDEAVFAEPDRFDITRTPNRHLALGSGEHFCIGSVLARAETRLLLAGLMDEVGGVEAAGPVVPARSLAVSGPEHAPVRLLPR